MALDILSLLGATDPRKQEAIRMGLLQAGLGMLASQQTAPSPYPVQNNLGALIGQGGLMGLQGYQQAEQMQQEQAYRDAILGSRQQEMQARAAEAQMEQQKALEEQRRLKEQEDYIKTLPPKEQKLARFAFKKYMEQQIENAYPDAASQTGLAKLMAEMEQLPEGDPRRRIYQQAITKESTFAPPQPPIVIPSYTYKPVEVAPGKYDLYRFPTHGGEPSPTGLKPAGQAGQAGQEKPLTEAEQRIGMAYGMMDSATKEMHEIEKQGFDIGSTKGQAEVAAASHPLGNFIASENGQRMHSAQQAWAEAHLRLKSGANITATDIEKEAAAFFPRIGDSSATVKQKARLRSEAQKQMALISKRTTKLMAGQDLSSEPQQDDLDVIEKRLTEALNRKLGGKQK